MSRPGSSSDEPKAVIQRRILDVADDMPDASLEEIADRVSGASTDLVDRVLAEYGDPGDEPPDETADGDAVSAESVDTDDGDADPTETDEDGSQPDSLELSETQRETLALIARNPDATQRELAAKLDVTAATISRWVNDIPGFTWSDREAFATRVLDDIDSTAEPDTSAPHDTPTPTAGGSDTATGDVAAELSQNGENGRTGGHTESDGDGTSEFADLRRRVAALEYRLEENRPEEEPDDAATADADGGCDDADPDRIDTELLHKVVSACMASERITENEEIRLLKHLLE